MKKFTALMTLMLWMSAPAAHSQPQRIVSLNPCLDALLVELAEPQQIAALSHYSSAASATSIPLALAARFPQTAGTAEDIILRQPDLVLGSIYETPQLQAALARYHIPFRAFDIANTVEASIAQINAIAARTGHPEKAEALTGRIRAALDAPGQPRAPLDAVMYGSGGLVLGTGTLTADLMARAGLRNVSAAYGIQAWGQLPLEKLVRQPPAVLIRAVPDGGRADRLLSHPILAHLPGPQRTFPASTLNCGGPSIIPAMHALARIRRSL